MSNQLYNELGLSQNIMRGFYTQEIYWKIPLGLDLDDTEMVKSYGNKWGKLFIELTNGEILEIEGEEQEIDYKRAEGEEIDEAENWSCEHMFQVRDVNDEIVRKLRREIAIRKGVIVLDELTIPVQIKIGEPTDDQIVAECLDSMIDRIQDAETNEIKENECPVCLEQFGEGNMKVETGDNCDHRICWLDFQTLACSTNSCPICRATLRGDAVESESDDESDESDDEEQIPHLDGEALMINNGDYPNPRMLVLVDSEWIDFDRISGINQPADQDILERFILSRQGLIENNWNEDGCRYCGIQRTDTTRDYYMRMKENILYSELEICLDANGRMFFDDGCCSLCRFIDTHTCDNCRSYSPIIDLRNHTIINTYLYATNSGICMNCEGRAMELDPTIYSRCRDAGCDLCADYESDSDDSDLEPAGSCNSDGRCPDCRPRRT
jgi:hypothetical protein